MVRTIGNQFLGAMFYQSVICISLDRLLVAALVLRYKIFVTKRRLLLIAILIWILSIMCAVIYGIWGIDSSLNRIIWMFWSSITMVSIMTSYLYIAVVLCRQKRIFKETASEKTMQRFNYEIPLCITLSYIVTQFIPDIVLVVDETLYSVWILVLFYANYLIDPLVYVYFGVYYKRRSHRHLPESTRSSTITVITTTI